MKGCEFLTYTSLGEGRIVRIFLNQRLDERHHHG